MPIRKRILGTDKFPIQEWMIFRKFKEIKGLCGDMPRYAAQLIQKIDEEIAEKGRFWMETKLRED